jgi:hypothetical protein
VGWLGGEPDVAAEQMFVSVARVGSDSKHTFALDSNECSWHGGLPGRTSVRQDGPEPPEERAFVERPF